MNNRVPTLLAGVFMLMGGAVIAAYAISQYGGQTFGRRVALGGAALAVGGIVVALQAMRRTPD